MLSKKGGSPILLSIPWTLATTSSYPGPSDVEASYTMHHIPPSFSMWYGIVSFYVGMSVLIMPLSNFIAHLKHVCKLEIAVRIFGSFFAYGVERGSCECHL